MPAAVERAAEPRPLVRMSVQMRRAAARWIGALGIRARLMLLVVALAMPFMLYIGALAWSQAQGERVEALARAEAMAHLVAARLDDFVDANDLLLRLLARTADGADPATVQRYVEGLRTELRPYVRDVAIWSAAGERIASLQPSVPGAADGLARDAFDAALKTGDLVIAGPVEGAAAEAQTVLFARSVLDARGRALGVVTVAARILALDRIIDASRTLPADAVVTVLDSRGVVVARSRDAERFVGRDMSHRFDMERFGLPHGSSEITGFDGVRRISGFATPERVRWKVYIGIPTEAALANLVAKMRNTTVLGGAALLVGLLLALAAGNGITHRLKTLAGDAARLEAGDLEHRSGVTGRDEVGLLGGALNRMAEALGQRSKALTHTTDELRLITANVPVLIAYVDAQQRYRFANEYHRDVFGVPPDQLLGRTLRELLGRGAYRRLKSRIEEVLSGLPASFETAFSGRSDAPYFLVSCFPDYGDDNAVRGFYAVCQDITRRRRAEEALAARERFTQLITDTIPARITYLDTAARIQFGNRHFAASWNADGTDFIGRPLVEVVPPAVYAQIAPHLARGLAGEPVRYDLSIERADGVHHDIVHYVPDRDAQGRVQGLFTISQDVTALKHLETARAESERRVRMIADNVPAAMAYVNRHERYLFANAGFVASFGFPLEELIGRRAADVLPPEVYATTRPHIEAVLRGERQRFQRVVTRLGVRRHELVEYIPELDEHGAATGFFALVHNITDLHDAQVRVEASEERLRSITENIPALICYVDREQRYRFNSRYYEEWLGRPLAEIVDRTVLEVWGEATYAVDAPFIARALAGERVDFEARHTDARGTRYVRGTYVPDVDASGRVAGFYGATTDVTSLKEVEKQLERLAQFDTLTGLPNRNQFNERIAAALARMHRTGLGVGVLFLDIDAFKRINDTRGHAAGDAVLREFGRRLRGAVRETDVVARLAGDEFVVVLEGVRQRDECLFVARKVVAAMRRPFAADGADLAVTTSIGIALTNDPSLSAENLLQKADGALYSAKARGRDRYEVAS